MRLFYSFLIWAYSFERDVAINPAVIAQASEAVIKFEGLRDQLMLREIA